jgi:hypothetical protein
MIMADIKSIDSLVKMESTSHAALSAGIIRLFTAFGKARGTQ